MKIQYLKLYSAIIAGAFLMSGCEQDKDTMDYSDKKPEVKQPEIKQPGKEMPTEKLAGELNGFIDSLANYTEDQKDIAVSAIKQEMQKLDERINKLELDFNGNGNEISDEMRSQQQLTLDLVKQKRELLSEWTSNLSRDTDKKWSDIINGLSDAYEQLVQAIDNAEHEFQLDKKPMVS